MWAKGEGEKPKTNELLSATILFPGLRLRSVPWWTIRLVLVEHVRTLGIIRLIVNKYHGKNAICNPLARPESAKILRCTRMASYGQYPDSTYTGRKLRTRQSPSISVHTMFLENSALAVVRTSHMSRSMNMKRSYIAHIQHKCLQIHTHIIMPWWKT